MNCLSSHVVIIIIALIKEKIKTNKLHLLLINKINKHMYCVYLNTFAQHF